MNNNIPLDWYQKQAEEAASELDNDLTNSVSEYEAGSGIYVIVQPILESEPESAPEDPLLYKFNAILDAFE